jgi:hypothetical protein
MQRDEASFSVARLFGVSNDGNVIYAEICQMPMLTQAPAFASYVVCKIDMQGQRMSKLLAVPGIAF